MDTLARLWRSTVGRKALVAASGLLLWLWVVLHVAGNLTLFSGPAAADGYAAALRPTPGAVWAARAAWRGRPVVALVSAAVTVGFASVPLAVLAGWLR